MRSRYVIYIPTDTREATAASFANVAGIPLFLRSILSLAAAGERSFTIISPASHRRHILKVWQKIINGRPIHLNLVLTGHNLTIANIKELQSYVEDNFYIINANYIFTSLSPLTPVAKKSVNLFRSTTKKTTLIGVSLATFSDFASDVREKKGELSSFLTALAEKYNHHYLVENKEDIIVQKFADIELAEHMLAENIRKNTPMWIAREINKRISLPISLALARLRVSPNTITAINMLIGLCAGIGAAGKTYIGVLLGAILFQTASIVDGCDGEVAKLTFRTSKFGQYIDSISDNVSLAGFLVGMMIHQRRITHSIDAYFWGIALLIGIVIIFAIMINFLKKNTDSASFVTFDKEYLQKLSPNITPNWLILLIKYAKMLFKKDCFSFMFLLFAIFGILHLWFYMVVIGVWCAVTVLLYLKFTSSQVNKFSS